MESEKEAGRYFHYRSTEVSYRCDHGKTGLNNKGKEQTDSELHQDHNMFKCRHLYAVMLALAGLLVVLFPDSSKCY